MRLMLSDGKRAAACLGRRRRGNAVKEFGLGGVRSTQLSFKYIEGHIEPRRGIFFRCTLFARSYFWSKVD